MRETRLYVIGLETNGGQGRYCYEGNRLRFINGIKQFAAKPKDELDRTSFYVGPNRGWNSSVNTVVDLTTVLKVQSMGSCIEVENVATLIDQSRADINRCYTALRSFHSSLDPLMTRNISKVNRSGKDSPYYCWYCKKIKTCPFVPVFCKAEDGADVFSGRETLYGDL